ncbi:MAG: kinase-like domain-containing protein [Piptocephalis tieghemiana]|nr:MAG: kinase-like domain-containing protein [Piptocephalis tieghemiana]
MQHARTIMLLLLGVTVALAGNRHSRNSEERRPLITRNRLNAILPPLSKYRLVDRSTDYQAWAKATHQAFQDHTTEARDGVIPSKADPPFRYVEYDQEVETMFGMYRPAKWTSRGDPRGEREYPAGIKHFSKKEDRALPMFYHEFYFTIEAFVLQPKGVVRVLDVYAFDENYWMIIMERADYDLHRLLFDTDRLKKVMPNYEEGKVLDEGFIRGIVLQVIKTLLVLNENDIVHKDIKPENILCFDQGAHNPCQPKLADFGLSSRGSKRMAKMGGGTPDFLPQAYLERKKPSDTPLKDFHVDTYSAVAMIHDLLTFPHGYAMAKTLSGFRHRTIYTKHFPKRHISLELIRIFKRVLEPKVWDAHPASIKDLWPLFMAWEQADLSKAPMHDPAALRNRLCCTIL